MANATSYIIWAYRDARSIFGPAANPVIRNGVLLSFKNRNGALSECDQLNANSGNPHVRYSVKRAAAARRLRHLATLTLVQDVAHEASVSW